MKRTVVIVALGLLVACAGAQWLETTVPADSYPTMLCYNLQDNFVYSANWGGDNVTVINGATNEVDTTIAVGVEPHAILYSPLNNKVFCFNEGSRSLGVINGSTHAVEATESLYTRPWDAVRCPVNNRVYVLGHNPDVVTVVDCATYDIDTTIAFPVDPYGVCYDSTDNRVYVATRADSTVRAIDCATNAVVATIKVGPAPNKLCWNSRENKVYTATSEGLDSTVTIIDCATNTVATSLKPARYPHQVGYDPLRSRVYVTFGYTNLVAVIDGAADSVVAAVPTTGRAEGVIAVPQHGYVFVAVSNDTVLVLDGLTGSVVARVGVGRGPEELIYNSTDDRVYAADYRGATVSILRASGGVAETPHRPSGHAEVNAPTIVRGVLSLDPTAVGGQPSAALLDAAGRKVMSLRPGANDVRALASGVYFVREAQTQAQAVRRVVVQR